MNKQQFDKMKSILKKAITFQPYLKEVIWGGQEISRYKNVVQDGENIGESWEISAVPGHVSVVDQGEYKGLTLTDLIDRFGCDLLGTYVNKKYNGKFPLLIKFIDAADNLSVQVHPDDALAKKRNDSLGKTEMWYIISNKPDAKIYAGMRENLSPDEFEKKAIDGSILESIAVHKSKPGDVFFLPAGRVHAIGAGNLLAEIQESSDITYRLYDYNRKDAQGNPRELHLQEGKEAIDYKVYDNYCLPSPDDSESVAKLAGCEHFETSRIYLNGSKEFKFDSSSFTIIICIEGEAVISAQDGDVVLTQGHTALIPAATEDFKLTGEGLLLLTRTPG